MKARNKMSTPSVLLSARTWPIRSVQFQLGNSEPISMSGPKLRAASGSQEYPVHRRAACKTRRAAVSISRSACPVSSSTATAAEGREEQHEFRRRMDEYYLHEEYYKSIRGEDGEEPLEALGSPPYTDMGSCPYSGPPTDLADTVSLPRRRRGPAWRLELPITSRGPEVCPAYVEESHSPGPTYGALDCTAELLAK